MNVIILGPAGSGKSLLTEKFRIFLEEQGYDAVAINLDPATPPRYEAYADIRDFVRTEVVMSDYSLGINGALLKSMELAENYIEKLKFSGHDFVIYDTPGQLELFLFTDFGLKFTKALEGFTAGVFVVDSEKIIDSLRFSAIISQSATISIMLEIPSLTVFNKSDLVEAKDFEFYRRELQQEGLLGEYFESLLKFIEMSSLIYRPIKISAKTGYGFYDLFTGLNELFCACGDLS